MKTVKWTKSALRNLNNEVDYIGRDNSQAAQNVAAFVRRTVNLLETMPQMGRTGRINGTKELIIRGLPYIVFYRIQGETIQITRVLHTSRKLRG